MLLKEVSHVHTQTHTHFAISSFSQHSKKLKAVRSDSLTVPVDTFTGQLHLLRLGTRQRRK